MSGGDQRTAAAGPKLLDDKQFMEALRVQMVKFAILQLDDGSAAEDAVQEALIGALKNVGAFGGRAAFKTWVFAILKNKIADVLRQRQRLLPASSLLRDDDSVEAAAALFDGKGYWRVNERPVDWGDPEASFSSREFWAAFEACLECLPPKHARVFMMREFVELDTDEICTQLGVTLSNLHVQLHRARLRLRECLEQSYGASASAGVGRP